MPTKRNRFYAEKGNIKYQYVQKSSCGTNYAKHMVKQPTPRII